MADKVAAVKRFLDVFLLRVHERTEQQSSELDVVKKNVARDLMQNCRTTDEKTNAIRQLLDEKVDQVRREQQQVVRKMTDQQDQLSARMKQLIGIEDTMDYVRDYCNPQFEKLTEGQLEIETYVSTKFNKLYSEELQLQDFFGPKEKIKKMKYYFEKLQTDRNNDHSL